jgi:hypothetical protein
MSEPAILIVQRIERVPGHEGRVVADLHIAGHPGRLELEFGQWPMNFVHIVSQPWLLGLSVPAFRAVRELLGAFLEGQMPALPMDLSAEVRRLAGGERLPFDPIPPDERARLEAAAANIDLALVGARRHPEHPERILVEVRAFGELRTVDAEVHNEPGRLRYLRIFAPLGDSRPEVVYALAHLLYEAQRRLAGP